MKPVKIKKILCAVDFSEPSEHSLRYAVAIAAGQDAELIVLHVMELPFLPSYATAAMDTTGGLVERVKEECERRLLEMVDKYRDQHPKISHSIVIGTPAMEIILAAKKAKCDLLVVGTHGHTGLKQMLIGSTAEKVVRKSPCPVLTVKSPKHQDEDT